MYDLNNYPSIISFLKQSSKVFKNMSNGWIQIFCPYCNDSNRKTGYLSHGHFYISSSFNYCKCFRCEHSSSFTKFLYEFQFPDTQLLKELSKTSGNYTAVSNKSRIIVNSNIREKIEKIYETTDRNNMLIFLQYVYSRCFTISPIDFLIFPHIVENQLLCGFYNNNGLHITSRYIGPNELRYLKQNNTDYYYFQDINTIYEYNSIVVCEGAFDLINLYNYYPLFKDSFFIAINGRDYRKIIKDLLSEYLLIGKYNINIVLDKGIKDLNKLKYLINLSKKQLNPNVNIKFYSPIVSKDVSEIMLIQQEY